MSRRARLLVSLVCALASAAVCLAYTGHVRGEAEQARTEAIARYGGDVVSLAVTTRAIEAGEVVQVGDVEQRDWISTLAPEGALMSVDDALGKEVSVPAAAGWPLTKLNFRDESQMADVPSGHVAVSIPVFEKLGVSSAMAVGSHVVMYRATENGAELVGSEAIVMAVPGANTSGATRTTLTLAIKPDDVPLVLSASTAGDLRLVVPSDDVRKLAAGGEGQTANVEPVNGKDRNKSDGSDESDEGDKSDVDDKSAGQDEGEA